MGNDFHPDYIVPPGATLSDLLEERGMYQAELAGRIGLSTKTLNEIIKGKAPITPETALHLENVFGVPARFWNNREVLYREAIERVEEREQILRHADWVRSFPYKQMARLFSEYLEEVDGRSQDAIYRQGRSLLTFFGLGTPEQWDEIWLNPRVAFRKSLAFSSDPKPISAWLQYGLRKANEMKEVNAFDRATFMAALRQIRTMTRESPEAFAPRMQQLCADSGVAVVFTPQLDGAKISGATQWVRPDLALIQLSLRGKTNDKFWFTFFHESAHILLHGKKDVFLEGSDDDLEAEKEEEANEWASAFLIPPKQLAEFIDGGDYSADAVTNFADSLGIAPGIAVGQLQHRGILGYNQLNGLRQKFVWV